MGQKYLFDSLKIYFSLVWIFYSFYFYNVFLQCLFGRVSLFSSISYLAKFDTCKNKFFLNKYYFKNLIS
jgi:hypothetical protein